MGAGSARGVVTLAVRTAARCRGGAAGTAPEGIYHRAVITGRMSTDEPSVPIVCTECETETSVPLSDVADALAKHNDGKHDGDEVAEVDPALKDRLADLVAEDLGLFDEA